LNVADTLLYMVKAAGKNSYLFSNETHPASPITPA
jgi:hypothetical protein